MPRKNFLYGEVVRLLRRVEKRILEEPKRFCMDVWADKAANYFEPGKGPTCGTVACIAGWAAFDGMNVKQIEAVRTPHRLGDRGRKKLEKLLGPFRQVDEYGQTVRGRAWALMDEADWPEKFRLAYGEATDKRHYGRAARIAVNRIEHFIKTGE